MSDRDRVVATLLRDLPVPDHRPGFWAELDARLAAVDATRGFDEPAATAPAPPRLATGELPLVRPLPIESRRERRARRRGRALAAAAVLVCVVLGGALLLARPDDPAPPLPSAAGTPPAQAPPDTADPEATVAAWVDALGAGDTERAWQLLSESSRQGWVSFEEFQRASGLFEGTGSWAAGDVDGRVVMSAQTPAHSGAVVVTMYGLISPEGQPEYRIQPFALVYDGDGWRIDQSGTFAAESAGPAIELRHPTTDASGVGDQVGPADRVQFRVPPGADARYITVQIDERPPFRPEDLDLSDTVVSVALPDDVLPGNHILTIAVILEDGSFYTATSRFPVTP